MVLSPADRCAVQKRAICGYHILLWMIVDEVIEEATGINFYHLTGGGNTIGENRLFNQILRILGQDLREGDTYSTQTYNVPWVSLKGVAFLKPVSLTKGQRFKLHKKYM